MSLRQIKGKLEDSQIKTASGKDIWHESVIQGMLCNEKCIGDSMLQKYFTQDFLTGKKAKNVGQKARYYVHDSHQRIISKEKFLKEAYEMNCRKSAAGNDNTEKTKK